MSGRNSCFILIFLILFFPWRSYSQEAVYNHPELDWFTIKTEHFQVHFHKGAERTAREVAKIAEMVYKPITKLYGYDDNKIFHFIIRDHDDISNGATYFYDDKIEIWAKPMDFDLRGTHPWLLNVVTHEFTHMISIDRSKKFGDHIPAFYFQFWGYEKETRPDVIRGFPNRIVSFPIAGSLVPPWFAEGVAQFQAPDEAFDYWDSHRDMILRMAALEDKMLSYTDMSSFGHTSLGNEMVYNSGFALVSYIAKYYGYTSLEQLMEKLSSPNRISFSGAVKAVLKKSAAELYKEWKETTRNTYKNGVREIEKNVVQGTIIEDKGFGNFYPAWSPTGKKIAFVTNNGNDYFGLSSLVLYDIETGKIQPIKSGVPSSVSFSPDGKHLVYAKLHQVNMQGSKYFDLFTYDLSSKKEKRLTEGARASNPSWSNDGKKIVCTVVQDGTNNLAVFDLQSHNLQQITHYDYGQQIFHPVWSPDGNMIVFDISTGHGRNIAAVNSNGDNFHYIIQDNNDARTPVFSPDNQSIYFAWDKTGIFNIYRYDLKQQKAAQITNVLGGAFMPAVDEKQGLAYSLYTADGYKIAHIEELQEVQSSNYLAQHHLLRNHIVTNVNTLTNEINGNDGKIVDGNSEINPAETYHNTYGAVNLLPRIIVDYGTLKLGSYLYSSEVLNKLSVFGGFAVNRRWDMDIVGIFEYRNFYPTFFLEVYDQIQHFSEKQDKFRYNLLEADLGMELPLFNENNTLRGMFVYSRYNGRIETTISGQEIKFGYTYMLGQSYSLLWQHNNVYPSRTMTINPEAGRKFTLRYDRQHNKFIDGFAVNSQYGTLVEVYKTYNYNQFSGNWEEYFSLPWHHTITLKLNGGYIDRHIDSFFNFFAGGILGLKGYPYYSIEGRKLFSTSWTYRFRLSDHLDFTLPAIKLDKLYAGLFFDYGNAWDKGKPQWDQFKKDAGIQIRLDTFSFYNFPTRFFFDVAYGFDKVVNREQIYGKEFRFYFGITFDYID